MSRKVVRHTYRNVKIRSILHFNSGLYDTDEFTGDGRFNKRYNLNDVVPENKIAVTGPSYRTNLSMFSVDTNYTGMINGKKISEYSNYGGYTYIVRNLTPDNDQKSYISGPCPFVLGGQDFTIEIGVYFKKIGPVIYFSPINQVNEIINSVTGVKSYPEFILGTSTESLYSFGLSLSSYKVNSYSDEYSYYFKLKLPGSNLLYLFNSVDYIIDKLEQGVGDDVSSLLDPKDCYLNTKLQIVIVYRHENAVNKINPFSFYINGYKGHPATEDEEEKFSQYIFNRTGFLYEFIGNYNIATREQFEIYFDEIRICDGKALYSGDEIECPLNTLYNFNNDEYQAKFVTHFDGAGTKVKFNKVTPPVLINSDPINKGFQKEIKFNGDHQYLEYIRDANLINGADEQTLTDIEPVSDHEDKYWKSGMNLGGRNFTIESFLKFDMSVSPIKKRTIFEFNEKGCTDPDHYFRMIYDYINQIMIVEQNNIIEEGYKELLRFTVPTTRKFHWFLCYHYNTKTLKAYIDENIMDENYILGLPKDYIDDITVERFIECGRNVTQEVKDNIKEYIAEYVDFNRVNFEHLVLASNVAPMNNDSSSYPYSNSYAGTIEEFRLLDGVAAEPYTPEFGYSIYDEIDDWDDMNDYEQNLLKLNFNVCNELPPTNILNLDFYVLEREYDYGPKDLLNLNFKVSNNYIKDDLLKLEFYVMHRIKIYENDNLLKLNFIVHKKYKDDELLKLKFKILNIGDYINDELLKLNFHIDPEPPYDYEKEDLLKLNFHIEPTPPYNYIKENLLKLKFYVMKWIKIYRSRNILNLNFKVNENLIYIENEFNTKRIIPDDGSYLVIAVSFV